MQFTMQNEWVKFAVPRNVSQRDAQKLAEAVLNSRRTVVAPLVHIDPTLTTDAAERHTGSATEKPGS